MRRPLSLIVAALFGVAFWIAAGWASFAASLAPPSVSGAVAAVGAAATFNSPDAVTLGSAYANGNCIGGVQTIGLSSPSNGVLPPSAFNGSLILQSLTVTDTSKQAAAMNVFVFDAPPTGSYVDKTSCAIAAADVAKIAAVIGITNAGYVQDGGATVSTEWVQGINEQVNIGTGTSLFILAMSNSATPTYSAATAPLTSPLNFKIKVTY